MCTSEKNYSKLRCYGSLLYKCKAASGKEIVNNLQFYNRCQFKDIRILADHSLYTARQDISSERITSLSPTSLCVLNSLNTAHLAVWTSRIILKRQGCLDQCLYKPHSQGTHGTLSLIFTKTEGWEKHGSFKFKFFATFLVLLRP